MKRIRYAPLLIALLLMGTYAVADEITVEFTAGEYTIEDVEDGQVIHIDGFGQAGEPGSPMLPIRGHMIALPPDVVWDSLSLSVLEKSESILPSVYDIAPHPPAAIRTDGGIHVDWGAATNILDGKDIDVYSRGVFTPAETVSMTGTGQLRKWKFVRVAFQPISCNPVSRQLRLCDGISVLITFTRDPDLLDEASLRDTVRDSDAAVKFINYHSAKEWYAPKGYNPLGDGDSFNYVIFTTETIRTSSADISGLKTHLENLGHSVLIVTEQDSYGDTSPKAGGWSAKTGKSPNQTPDKIRKWLQDYDTEYGIEYVLLIGDPHPSTGDVPMKDCYPYSTHVYTDYYFADLSGDWDANDDGYFGYYAYDEVDFEAEVYVARIPVYDDDYGALNSIIDKIITYETATGSANLGWRRSMLIALSFPWKETDPSYFGNAMKTDFLQGRSFSTYEMYQDADPTYCSSYYPYDEQLTGGTGSGTLYNRWVSHPIYGMMWWFGHGVVGGDTVTGEYSVVGNDDDTDDCYEGLLFHYTYCSSLDDTHPAFTFQLSCANGFPKNPDNLGYQLLKKGAINTCSAAVSCYGYLVNFNKNNHYAGSQDIGYWYADNLSDYAGANGACAKAKYEACEYLYGFRSNGYAGNGVAWHNYMDFNLYGCPHTRLIGDLNTYIRLEDFEAHARGDKIVLTWETGAEVDNAGFLIYRFDGNERKAISRLIPAEGSPRVGASYRFVDGNVRRGVTYQYWLVDVDTSGTWTAHGPVRARLPIRLRDLPNSEELTVERTVLAR